MSRVTEAGIGFLTLVLTGCIVHVPKYPPDWSALNSVSIDSCIDLVGTFENVGQSAEQQGNVYLSQILFPHDKDINATALAVRIESSGRSLQAIATLPDGTTRRTVLQDTAKCSPQEHYIKDLNNPGGVNSEGIAGVINTTLELFRADDGSLVVRTTERDLVVAFLIPVGTNVKYWLRFAEKAPVKP